jgi:hypothetical protein
MINCKQCKGWGKCFLNFNDSDKSICPSCNGCGCVEE